MNKRNRKNKIHYLYLPVWVIAAAVLVCLAAGAFMGYVINKPNDSAQSKDNQISSDDLLSEQTSTDHSRSKVDKTEWNLILVNKWNALPEHYEPVLKYLQNGHAVDERCYDDLQAMMDDCRAAGLTPVICSSYRTMQKQEELFDNQVNKWLSQGYSDEKAKQAAGELVAVPGTSEHQLGLALDIVDISNQILDERQENTDVQKWLMNNSWKYGFILRYPTDKSEITGISYEPWHYRYVGKQAAKEIYDAGICLEEYLES